METIPYPKPPWITFPVIWLPLLIIVSKLFGFDPLESANGNTFLFNIPAEYVLVSFAFAASTLMLKSSGNVLPNPTGVYCNGNGIESLCDGAVVAIIPYGIVH